MATHNDTGKLGEELAEAYLIGQSFAILHKNWRYKKLEVDLIISKNNILHFVEVKCRASEKFGYPEENVTSTKLKNVMKAAEQYLYEYPQWKKIQFDILSVVLSEPPNFFLIEDVFDF